MLKWEIKKILKEKSSIIALAIIVLLFLQIFFVKPTLETENEKFKIKVDEIKLMLNSQKDNKLLIDLSNEKLKLDDGNKYENINFYKVFTYRLDFTLSIMMMIIIILLLVSNLYTDEVVSKMSPIILSSKNKNKVLFSKLGLSILIPLVLYGIYTGYVFLITYMQYGYPLNGNFQAYRISDIAILTKAITINQYMISKIITTTLILLGISIVSMLVSFLSKNSVQSICLSVGFILIGKILVVFRFLPKPLLLLLSTSNYIDVVMGMSNISGIYNGNIEILSKTIDISNLCVTIYGLIVLLGVVGCIYTIKKVLAK